jgi:hypothetical protein
MKLSRANPGTNGIEQCLSQRRSVDCSIGAPVGIEELPSRAEKYG